MPEIKIAVINKVPKIVGDIRCIVADNSDYTIRFTFDDMWEDGEKTVYFVRENGFAFPVGRTEDDTVTVPIQHEPAMHSMLFVGVQQGDVKTSRPVEMRVVSAITDLITDDAVQPEPSMWEGVLLQIAAMQDELDGKVDGDELAAAVEDALTDAKESGEFNGPPGPPGSDYVLTEEDKKEIAEMVNASPAGAAPLYLTAEMDANGRYTIDGYTSAELTAAAREREVKLMLHSGVRVVLATLYPDIGFVGARYILGDGDGVISVNVLVSVFDRDDGIEGIWGNVIEAPGGGSGSGGILAFMAPGYVPCEDYATKYYRIPIGDEPEELTIDQLADAYTSSGLTLMLIGDDGANGVVRAVLRPAPENVFLGTLGFTGEYWVESDVPAEVVPVTPITATIKQDGTITIRLAETRPSVLHLIALGNLPGSTGIVHDTNGVTWTADSLPLAYAERPVELRVIQDPMGTPGSDIYVPARDSVFKMYNVTGGGSDGTPRAVVFHGHYWGDDLAGWVPAVAVVGEDGRCTVADAAWDGYAREPLTIFALTWLPGMSNGVGWTGAMINAAGRTREVKLVLSQDAEVNGIGYFTLNQPLFEDGMARFTGKYHLDTMAANEWMDAVCYIYEDGAIAVTDVVSPAYYGKSEIDAKFDALAEPAPRYGVSGVGGSQTTLTRIWDAAGLTAAVGTDVPGVHYNNFDDLKPFSRRKCVGTWSTPDESGRAHFTVGAYYGDPDYTEDGSKGDYVAVEVEPFWFYQDLDKGVIGVSPGEHAGWSVHPVCVDEDGNVRERTYLPCYNLAVDRSGHAVSLPGYHTSFGHYQGLRNICRTYGGGNNAAHLEPMAVRHYEWLLFTIEFATTNCQSIMQGAASMPYAASNTVSLDGTDVDYVVVTSDIGGKHVVGQTIYIGATHSDNADADALNIITAIEPCDPDGTPNESGTYRRITYSGRTNTVTAGTTTISTRPWITGSCNDVTTPSGSPVSNTGGKYPMRYRYRENIWANCYSTCNDLFDQLAGAGTDDDPYHIIWHYLIDPDWFPVNSSRPNTTDFASESFKQLAQVTEHVSGYIKKIEADPDHPECIVPVVQTGGGSGTYFADYGYFVNGTTGIRSVRFGGYVPSGVACGVLFFRADNPVSYSNWPSGGGLYFRQ